MEILVEEIRLVNTKKLWFDYRDESMQMEILSIFLDSQVSDARKKIEKFPIKLISTTKKSLIETLTEDVKPALMGKKSLNIGKN